MAFLGWLNSRNYDQFASHNCFFKISEKEYIDKVKLWYPEVYNSLNGQIQAPIKTYANGDHYEGDLTDGKRSGTGELTREFCCGRGDQLMSYNGSWKDDMKHGGGVLHLANGWVYDGNFENDRKNGLGIMYFRKISWLKDTKSESCRFNGLWDKTTFDSSISRRLEIFKLASFQGGGTRSYSFYKGTWVNDCKTGLGMSGRVEKCVHFHGVRCLKRNEHTLGWLFEGEFLNGLKHGNGKYISDDGIRSYDYTGGWVMDKEHGHGKYTCNDGSSYEGEWQSGKKHGTGVERTKFGDVYEGGWDNNRYHGVGKYTCNDGSTYEGEWNLGRKHGHGNYRNTLGDVYEGDWDANRYHGVGSLINEGKGERKVGEWRNGVLYNGSASSPTSKVSKR